MAVPFVAKLDSPRVLGRAHYGHAVDDHPGPRRTRRNPRGAALWSGARSRTRNGNSSSVGFIMSHGAPCVQRRPPAAPAWLGLGRLSHLPMRLCRLDIHSAIAARSNMPVVGSGGGNPRASSSGIFAKKSASVRYGAGQPSRLAHPADRRESGCWSGAVDIGVVRSRGRRSSDQRDWSGRQSCSLRLGAIRCSRTGPVMRDWAQESRSALTVMPRSPPARRNSGPPPTLASLCKGRESMECPTGT